MTWVDISFDVRSFDPDSWGPSWGLTWEAAQDDLSPRGRSSFVKFQPVRRGAAVLVSATARAQTFRFVAVGWAGVAAQQSQAGVASLGLVSATARAGRLRSRGGAYVGALVRLSGVRASAKVVLPVPAAGAAIAPYSAAAVSHIRLLRPEAAGVVGIYPQFAGVRLYGVQPTGVQNLTDEELIGLFLQARRRSLLTGRVNHL